MAVKDWSDLCLTFVGWLVEKGHLTARHLPVLNHARRDKYFVNTQPDHLDSNRDGAWHEAGGFFVDTKYAADKHVKNLQTILEHLGIEDLKVKFGPF